MYIHCGTLHTQVTHHNRRVRIVTAGPLFCQINYWTLYPTAFMLWKYEWKEIYNE